MIKRPEYTVILATDSSVYRGDFAGRSARSIAHVDMADLNVDGTLVEAVRLAIELSQPIGRKVAVCSTAVWNQVIAVPRLSVADLGESELEGALKFEAETLVGIDAENAVLSAVDLGDAQDQRRFWVNVTELSQWQSIVDLISDARGKLVWLAHPVGAVSGSKGVLHPPQIEIWGNSISRMAGGGTLQSTSEAGLNSPRWATDLGFASTGSATTHQPWLLGPDPTDDQIPESINEVIKLSDERQLKLWLQTVATGITDFAAQKRPLIRQQRRASSSAAGLFAKVAAALLVIVFCGWHMFWLNGRNARLVQEIAASKQPAIEKKKYDTLLQSVLTKRTQTKVEATQAKLDARKVQFLFGNQRDRIQRLLKLLVDLRTSDLVVKEIALNEKGTVVSGISLNGQSAPNMANRLRDMALPLGWKIHPATQSGEMKMISGGPWKFTILLEDVGPPDAQTEAQVSLPPVSRTARAGP